MRARKDREDLADQLARAIHQAYVRNCEAHGDSPLVNHSMRPWEELSDDLKQSNLEQAAHIGTKLDAIGCVVVPESATTPHFAFSDTEIELLAKMEHRRWVDDGREGDLCTGRFAKATSTPTWWTGRTSVKAPRIRTGTPSVNFR